ncbi:MAG: hypothetical protein BWY74_02042 [Firmicutes bacterium ADurb.Bin419]|nr:MAG: hypothetical protein BWY74_02042 [Firmicutes bacterium ADurb.Bin419]
MDKHVKVVDEVAAEIVEELEVAVAEVVMPEMVVADKIIAAEPTGIETTKTFNEAVNDASEQKMNSCATKCTDKCAKVYSNTQMNPSGAVAPSSRSFEGE